MPVPVVERLPHAVLRLVAAFAVEAHRLRTRRSAELKTPCIPIVLRLAVDEIGPVLVAVQLAPERGRYILVAGIRTHYGIVGDKDAPDVRVAGGIGQHARSTDDALGHGGRVRGRRAVKSVDRRVLYCVRTVERLVHVPDTDETRPDPARRSAARSRRAIERVDRRRRGEARHLHPDERSPVLIPLLDFIRKDIEILIDK